MLQAGHLGGAVHVTEVEQAVSELGGLDVLVINAGLLYLVGSLVKGFHVAGFWPAFWGALIISFVSLVLNTLTGTGESRVRVRRSTPASKPPGGDGNGPVIDV
mgnify:CR=1 FL=1